jgi:uncharacterized damage-inducible protein DinB
MDPVNQVRDGYRDRRSDRAAARACWNREMDVAALLVEIYDRVPGLVRGAVDGLDAELLRARPSPKANSVGWLIWHLARIQDHHVAEVLEVDQVWVEGSWAAAVGLEPDPSNTGYGHSAEDVDTVRPESAAALVEYLDAVSARTRSFLEGLDAGALDRVVDRRWDPPVTLGVRLVSVADDCVQHAGQAAYVRGLLLG